MTREREGAPSNDGVPDIAETLAILRKSRLNPEETAEGATLDPTADIAKSGRLWPK